MKKNHIYHKTAVNFLIINFIYLQATCGEPEIPRNGSLHSTSKYRNSEGEYPHGTEAVFRVQTGNGTTRLHSFCQGGNWSEIFPFIGIHSFIHHRQ